MNIRACLFDLDGTLVDTEPLWVAALRLSLDEMSCPLEKEQADELVYECRRRNEGYYSSFWYDGA